ncbi:hypothetical protein [Streptomyces uncialis]|uniref:hypothetical protein n=1 Tax=Streptomyces uncialis TaxID=1048205 RepID=UPI0022569C0B|nr:hypothetical protein [Streptomyces uncialis]MCX4661949.1 hypothetical protein [Streptomyces uncialis]
MRTSDTDRTSDTVTASDTDKLETTLGAGRRVTLSLPPTDAPWAAGGVGALRAVPPTHTEHDENPPPLPEEPALPLSVAMLGLGI